MGSLIWVPRSVRFIRFMDPARNHVCSVVDGEGSCGPWSSFGGSPCLSLCEFWPLSHCHDQHFHREFPKSDLALCWSFSDFPIPPAVWQVQPWNKGSAGARWSSGRAANVGFASMAVANETLPAKRGWVHQWQQWAAFRVRQRFGGWGLCSGPAFTQVRAEVCPFHLISMATSRTLSSSCQVSSNSCSMWELPIP